MKEPQVNLDSQDSVDRLVRELRLYQATAIPIPRSWLTRCRTIGFTYYAIALKLNRVDKMEEYHRLLLNVIRLEEKGDSNEINS